MKACWEGCFYLIPGNAEQPRTTRPVFQTKHYLVQNVSGAEPENHSPMCILFVYRTQRWSVAQAWLSVSLLGLHLAFSPSHQVSGKKTAFMTQRAAGKGNKMTVVSDTNNHKWLGLSCFFFRVRAGLDWPVIIIKRLFRPVSISSIHSGHSPASGCNRGKSGSEPVWMEKASLFTPRVLMTWAEHQWQVSMKTPSENLTEK